jgi:hypothetical protein
MFAGSVALMMAAMLLPASARAADNQPGRKFTDMSE